MANVKGYQTASVAAVASVAASTSIPFNYAYQLLVFRESLDAPAAAGAAIVGATTIAMAVVRHRAQHRADPIKDSNARRHEAATSDPQGKTKGPPKDADRA